MTLCSLISFGMLYKAVKRKQLFVRERYVRQMLGSETGDESEAA